MNSDPYAGAANSLSLVLFPRVHGWINSYVEEIGNINKAFERREIFPLSPESEKEGPATTVRV